MGRKCGTTLRTPRKYFVIFVETSIIRDLLHERPHRFHIGSVKREVRLLLIYPVPDALRKLVPRINVRQYTLATLLIKRSDAVLLNIRLA